MALSRRQILFGGAFAGLAGGMAGTANACSIDMSYPWQLEYWRRKYFARVQLPALMRQQARAFVSAVLHGSRPELRGLLHEEATLILPPRGAFANPDPARIFNGAGAISHLSRMILREGRRRFEIHHAGDMRPDALLLDVTMAGYGPPVMPNGQVWYGGGSCDDLYDRNDWSRRIGWRIEFQVERRSGPPPLIRRIMMIEEW